MIDPAIGSAASAILSEIVSGASKRYARVFSCLLMLIVSCSLTIHNDRVAIVGPIEAVRRLLGFLTINSDWLTSVEAWLLRPDVRWTFPVACVAAALYAMRSSRDGHGTRVAWLILLPSSAVIGGAAFGIFLVTMVVTAVLFVFRSLLETVGLELGPRNAYEPPQVVERAVISLLLFLVEPVYPVLGLLSGVVDTFTYDSRY